ncbi:Hypp7820 [Branchiostoma lanceolatum]|uniref:Hypp7820 protein n=1 Tax=Branchiostoma lanceolatum TaxID=7740 RepID=A0A8K0ECQ2_BRALA|nr:Hypp7820 [Branchiostoma lanceolatum]
MRQEPVFLLVLGFLTCLKTGESLTCYTCKESFNKWFYYSTVCENEVTRDNSSLSSCGASARYCSIERTTVNGIVTNFERACADTCYWGCKISGLGVTKEICTSCCPQDGCNHGLGASAGLAPPRLVLTLASLCAILQPLLQSI